MAIEAPGINIVTVHVPITTPADYTRAIVKAVADKYGFTVEDILSGRRTWHLVEARHTAIREVYEANPSWSYPKLGKFFGLDHTSIIFALDATGGRRRLRGLAQVDGDWRHIPSLPHYLASSAGAIRFQHSAKPRRPFIAKNGYAHVAMYTLDRLRVNMLVHRLVCEAFNGPPPFATDQCRHLDGDRLNNRPDNLRWGTAKENAADRDAHGNTCRGDWNGNRSINSEQAALGDGSYSITRVR